MDSIRTDEQALIERALGGDEAAVRQLVDVLTPVIQARVARALVRRKSQAIGRNVHQEVEDLTQEVFVALFTDSGRRLCAWNPERGLSLANFVGLLAEREVASILRSGKRSPWTEDPMLDQQLAVAVEHTESHGPRPDQEVRLASREMVLAVLEGLRARVSPAGLQIFYLLVVEERPVAEVCTRTGLKPSAVYAWKSRLGSLARAIAAEIEPTPGAV